ncbi:MAG: hypothetical protein KAS32_20960, partial [Candidatus Peribacteraceae bacterium]|nr:hypothetical protein [Candidatus Peribacteraceae bacterium]
MRLTRYIVEAKSEEPYDIVKGLYSKSFPYIKEIIKSLGRVSTKTPMMLSGRSSDKIVDTRKIRKDRHPKDTPEHVQDVVDDHFQDMFGTRYRSNSIFTTGRILTASSYGTVYGIFPNGNRYKFAWNINVTDLWSNVLEDNYEFLGDEEDVINTMVENGEYQEQAWGMAVEDFDRDNTLDDYLEDVDEDDYETQEEYAEALSVAQGVAEDNYDVDRDRYAQNWSGDIERDLARE